MLKWDTGVIVDAKIKHIPMLDMSDLNAYIPQSVRPEGFNPRVELPYGCTAEQIRLAMNEFVDFLSFVNRQLATKDIPRLETLLMPANFSSMVGEFVIASIPKYCPTLAKNRYHNGHPDLIPADRFPGNRVQYTHEGIEIKGSRYLRGWQGHNPEDVWLMVFVFESNRASDMFQAEADSLPARRKSSQPIPFRFLMVIGAQLTKSDWKFAGRSATSRRTITASVADSGYHKLMENWIYRAPDLDLRE